MRTPAPDEIPLLLSVDELLLITNCMNVAINCVPDDFASLVGRPLEEGRQLHQALLRLLDQVAPPPVDELGSP